jgi:hypothetical protein
MSKTSAILNYPKAAIESQNNSDRLAAFLEMNKPKKFSKRELGMALYGNAYHRIATLFRERPEHLRRSENQVRSTTFIAIPICSLFL